MMPRSGLPRLRRDFEASGMAPKICGSFHPRVTGGPRTLEADHQIDGWKRYKKAMDAVGQSLRPDLLCMHCRRGLERLGPPQRDDPASGSRCASVWRWRSRRTITVIASCQGWKNRPKGAALLRLTA